MMTHQLTSAQAYNDLETRGILGGQRLEIFRAFERFGPGTSAEVLRAAHLDSNRNLARARVTELANEGRLYECEPRKCRVTGRRATVWRARIEGEKVITRERVYRVELKDADVQAIADFQSGKRGMFCPNMAKAHAKIIKAGSRK